MTREEYRKLAAQFRAKARNEESPAYRGELEDLARCYESAAEDLSRVIDKGANIEKTAG